jgi:hypothetical protein
MTLSSLLPRSCSSLSLFLSYPSEQRVMAMEIAQALTNSGHRVFYDQDSLPAGGDHNERIRKAIEQADRVVFLATKNAFESGRYSLTELEFAKRRFPSPTGRVFPVLVDRSMKAEELPVYLRSVQAVTIHGNVVAETTAVIDETRTARRWCLSCVLLSAVLLVTAAGVALVPELIRRDPAPEIAPHAKVQPEEVQPRQAIGASDSSAPPAQSYRPLAPALSQKNHVIGFTYRTSSTEIDPGLRVFRRQANGTWTNTYPSGFVDTSHEKARIELSGCTGAVVGKESEPEFAIFIPDKGCPGMMLRFRRGNNPWVVFGHMENFR